MSKEMNNEVMEIKVSVLADRKKSFQEAQKLYEIIED